MLAARLGAATVLYRASSRPLMTSVTTLTLLRPSSCTPSVVAVSSGSPASTAGAAIIPVSSAVSVRYYAKKPSKDREAAAAAEADLPPFEFNIADMQRAAASVLEALKREFASIQVGRASPSLLESIQISYDGTVFSLSDVAQVNIKDPQTLAVIAYDDAMYPAIQKAIANSKLEVSASMEKTFIKVSVPKTTKEVREAIVKQVKVVAEKYKNSVRDCRQDAMKKLKSPSSKLVSVDEIRRLEKSVQQVTEKNIEEVESILKAKVADLLKQ